MEKLYEFSIFVLRLNPFHFLPSKLDLYFCFVLTDYLFIDYTIYSFIVLVFLLDIYFYLFSELIFFTVSVVK
jgi:hypothetical protein